jgi:hypothetical protein
MAFTHLTICFSLPSRITAEYQIENFNVFSIGLETSCPVMRRRVKPLFRDRTRLQTSH